MTDSCCSSKAGELERFAQRSDQRRVLVIVLAVNAIMFVLEFGAGLFAGSTALMADASDMLGDALVYGVSIYALARSDAWKVSAAMIKGLFILLLGVGAGINALVKIGSGIPPSSTLMILFGALALAANLLCLLLLWRFRGHDVNMSSTFECSRNDVISNVGVLIAGGLVAATGSPWPDLLIGSIIALILLRSGIGVIVRAGEQVLS